MQALTTILADSADPMIRGLIFVAVLVIWGISSLAKMAKKSNEKQKQRLRAVRESMGQAQRLAQNRAAQVPGRAVSGRPARAPVQLAPEIARRVPPPRATRAPAKRPARRGATDYNAMAQAMNRPAPPPLPAAAKRPVLEEVTLVPETVAPPAPVTVRRGRPATVTAPAIRKWLTPATLRQQFILTELFQPPIALREDHLW